MRSISERALSEDEKAVLRAAQIQAGVSVEEVNEMLDDEISNMPTVTFDPVLALGQSKRTLSWIWYTASGSEVLEDNVNESKSVRLPPVFSITLTMSHRFAGGVVQGSCSCTALS